MKNKNYPLYPITKISTLKQLIYNVPTIDENIAFMYTMGKKKTVEVTYAQFKRDIDHLEHTCIVRICETFMLLLLVKIHMNGY